MEYEEPQSIKKNNSRIIGEFLGLTGNKNKNDHEMLAVVMLMNNKTIHS